MARMHTRRKGKSKSKKVIRNKIPEWQELKEKEIIDKIISDDFDNVGSLVSKRLRLVRRE